MRTDRVVEVVGMSAESWEAAGREAVADAARVVPGMRSAEVVKQDVVVEDGIVVAYRVRLAVACGPEVLLVPDPSHALADEHWPRCGAG